MAQTFGEFFATRRREVLGVTLRRFCREHGFDPGNISKLERGKLQPPSSRDKLEAYARALGLDEGSDDWFEFFDLAAAARHVFPDDLMTDEDVVRKLPVLFRRMRGDPVPDEDLEDLIDLIRRA